MSAMTKNPYRDLPVEDQRELEELTMLLERVVTEASAQCGPAVMLALDGFAHSILRLELQVRKLLAAGGGAER